MKYIARTVVALAAVVAAAPAGAATLHTAAIGRPGSSLPTLTATRAFPLARGTSVIGAAPASMPMHVTLGLAPRNASQIDVLLRRQMTPGDAMYHRYLTPAETNAAFAPTGASVQAAASFLERSGFTHISVTPDNLLVRGDGTAALANAAFKTQIALVSDGRSAMFANVKPAVVPAELGGIVTAVLGLDNRSMRTHIVHASAARQAALRHAAYGAATRTAASPAVAPAPAATTTPAPVQPCTTPVNGSCVLNGYSATGFQLAYDSPQHAGNTNFWGYTGSATTIALFTEGDMDPVLPDLALYEKNNVPVLPTIKPHVIYAGIKSPDVSGQDEWDLDSQTSTGMAGNVKALYFYVATTLTDSDTAVAFDRFKTDDIAKAGSASFGECELFPMLDGAEVVEDKIFAEAAVQGQTIFSSAGDNGTTCPVGASTGVPGTGLPAQSYPGVSPYVVSVGGTTLVTTVGTGAYSAEVAWYGTGGGLSVTENAPFWQAGVVNPAATKGGYKEVPDVAMDADPNTGANIYVNGVLTGVGGTSLSSPLSLGVWSRIETHFGNKLGFAAPLFYKEYKNYTTYNATAGQYVPPVPPVGALTQPIGGFHDVITGTNGTPALPGYDTTTGVGTFDITKAIADQPTSY